MKKIHFLFMIIITSAFNSYAQNSAKTNKTDSINQAKRLVGTWRLITFADLDSASGKWIYPYGENPKGFFTYTKNNIVNLNISSEIPLKISEDSTKNYSVNLYNYIWHYALGYFGTYSIDFKNSTVIHHVTGGTIPYYIDTDQPRPFTFKGDTLIIGDNKTWKRVLVKAD